MTTSQLLQIISDLLSGGSPLVTKAEHKPVLDQIATSLLNKETDLNLIGLLQHDPSRAYQLGEAVMKDGQLWQSNQAIGIEAWNVTKWNQITGTVALSDYGIAEWENDFPSGSSGGYPEDAQAVRDDKLWRSDSDANTSDPLVSGWTEISANDGNFGNDWVVGLYKQNQVITNQADKKLYYVAAASNFNSVDIAAEITGGDFVLFHDVGAGGGVPPLLENQMYVGDATDLPVGTDEITKDGASIKIKNLLKMPDNKKLSFGDTADYYFRYESAGDKLVLYNGGFGGPIAEFSFLVSTFVYLQTQGFTIKNISSGNQIIFSQTPPTSFNIDFPAKAGTQTFAFLSDIPSPIFNVPQLFNEFNLFPAVIITGTASIVQAYNPSNPGNYTATYSGTIEITGSENCIITLRINGVNIAGGFRRIYSNQGGGAARLVNLSVHVETMAFAIASPTDFVELVVQHEGIGGLARIKEGVMKVYKLS